MLRIGYGSDIHRLVPGRSLILGGIRIESEVGAEGHSDADVLTHAVTDAILGALALGDIGGYFPNSDERWLNANSSDFLRYAVGLLKEGGYVIQNVDSTVNLERPRLRPYIDAIRKNLSVALEVEQSCVSVKAKTSEGVDAVGLEKAVRAEAVVLIGDTG